MSKTFNNPNAKYSDQFTPVAQVYDALEELNEAVKDADAKADANKINFSSNNITVSFSKANIQKLCRGESAFLQSSGEASVKNRYRAWICGVNSSGPILLVSGTSGGSPKTIRLLTHWLLQPSESNSSAVSVYCLVTLLDSADSNFTPSSSTINCTARIAWV